MGRLAVEKLIDLAAGRPVPRHFDNGYQIVSPHTFERLVAQGQL